MQRLYLGYDPGGGGAHGVAFIDDDGASCATLATAEDAIRWFKSRGTGDPPIALGVDTLTLWSTGPSGWRPADRALRGTYPQVASSIASPNYLSGSMAVTGAAVSLALRRAYPFLKITETHPKVLYYCLTQTPYDFDDNRSEMIQHLATWIGSICTVNSEHEWDALVSAFAAREWDNARWLHDLHSLPAHKASEQLIPAHGTDVHYAWPTAVEEQVGTVSKRHSDSRRGRLSRDRWRVAVKCLEDAGHDDIAKLVNDYRNTRGERSGWDGWLRSNFPGLWHLVENAK